MKSASLTKPSIVLIPPYLPAWWFLCSRKANQVLCNEIFASFFPTHFIRLLICPFHSDDHRSWNKFSVVFPFFFSVIKNFMRLIIFLGSSCRWVLFKRNLHTLFDFPFSYSLKWLSEENKLAVFIDIGLFMSALN